VHVQREAPQSVPERITSKDGAPMVLIPGGEFQMGSPDGKDFVQRSATTLIQRSPAASSDFAVQQMLNKCERILFILQTPCT
jgi:formylglycine-generating enzyme required for sulfatase activity